MNTCTAEAAEYVETLVREGKTLAEALLIVKENNNLASAQYVELVKIMSHNLGGNIPFEM